MVVLALPLRLRREPSFEAFALAALPRHIGCDSLFSDGETITRRSRLSPLRA
jgi:hypothetical protein